MPLATTSTPPDRSRWDELAARPRPSWYLDPLVALQKRRVHQELIRRWVGVSPRGVVFKTDLFEDAWGLDAIVFDLFDRTDTLIGTDIAENTVATAVRAAPETLRGFVCDLLRLPVAPGAVDLVLSTSTLDHFATRREFEQALSELAAAVRTGGHVVITLDNRHNPAWPILRLASRAGLMPFRLGYSPSLRALQREMQRLGFEILDTAWLIHNPRLLSTALFTLIRRTLPRRADALISALLGAFRLLERLPTRGFSACFYAVYARKTGD